MASFIAFGLVSQAVLAAFFAAKRWAPALAQRFGWMAYAVSGLGLPVAAWLYVGGAEARVYVAPLLMAAWAAFGWWIDLHRHVEWRSPIRVGVFLPYVTLYFLGQMSLWWPLWDFWRLAWWCFLALFAVNTLLNLRGHFGSSGAPDPASAPKAEATLAAQSEPPPGVEAGDGDRS